MNGACFQFVKLGDMQDPDIALECAYTTECARYQISSLQFSIKIGLVSTYPQSLCSVGVVCRILWCCGSPAQAPGIQRSVVRTRHFCDDNRSVCFPSVQSGN